MSKQQATPASGHFASSRILLHSPDITLKGKNQAHFQQALVRNLRCHLHSMELVWHVGAARGRAYVDTEGRDPGQVMTVLQRLQCTAGVSSLAATQWIRPGEMRDGENGMAWSRIEERMLRMARHYYVAGGSFAVRVHRVDKSLPFRSQELAARLGQAIRDGSDWQRVDLSNPTRTFYIDAYPDGLYLYAEKHPGIGGLPVGTGGRTLALLSGGIDSPVAAFMLAKRGCDVDFFHISASHIPAAALADTLVARLARQLSLYTQSSRLYVTPNTFFDLAMKHQDGYALIIFRRFLMRVATALAQRIEAQALITGDSLGQVASQTIENICTASQVAGHVVFRPLIGMNKQEIIAMARRINTYELSIQPYKDCCALIGRAPKTRSTDAQVSALEAKQFTDYAGMVEATLDDMQVLEFQCGQLMDQEISR